MNPNQYRYDPEEAERAAIARLDAAAAKRGPVRTFADIDRERQAEGIAVASSWDFASWRESVRRLDHSRRAEFRGASLDACLTVACSARAFAYAEALISGADAPPGVYAAFGCHPLSAREWFDPALDLPARARRLVEARGRVVAVGECGLDYHRPNRSAGDPPEPLSAEAKDVQRRAFVDQMALATELGAPRRYKC